MLSVGLSRAETPGICPPGLRCSWWHRVVGTPEDPLNLQPEEMARLTIVHPCNGDLAVFKNSCSRCLLTVKRGLCVILLIFKIKKKDMLAAKSQSPEGRNVNLKPSVPCSCFFNLRGDC